MNRPASEKELPEQVGPYKVQNLLGSGSMASVYLAEQAGPGGFRKKVALKVVDKQFAQDENFVRLLMREAAIGGMLRHPNIIQTLSFEQYGDLYVLVLEYVEGETVEDLLKRAGERSEHVPASTALDVVIQACRALDYAHSLRDDEGKPLTIVHRDLKPANLIRSRHGVVKVMDFGIARATASWAALTAQGVIRGTPSYMSPEQVLGRELDGRSDLFTLGAILYELLTTEVLFQGTTMLKVMERVAKVEVGDAFEQAERALAGMGAVLRKLLAPHPDDRYQRASELADELKGLLLGETGVPVAAGPTITRMAAVDLSGVTDMPTLGEKAMASQELSLIHI